MFDWDDLKYFLSVAHHGSTLAASRALGVDQSTVQRRVAELERRVGLVLIKRERNGYRLTEVGESLLTQAERIQLAVEAFERDVTTARDAAIGVIRVTCPEPLALRLSRSSLIDRFHALHPGLQVDFVMSDRYLDLTKAKRILRSGPETPTTASSSGERSVTLCGRFTPAGNTSTSSECRNVSKIWQNMHSSGLTTRWRSIALPSGCAPLRRGVASWCATTACWVSSIRPRLEWAWRPSPRRSATRKVTCCVSLVQSRSCHGSGEY